MECKNEAIGKYISEIYRNSCRFFSKEFLKLNLGVGQYIFLIQLYKRDGINQEELSELLKIDKANTARAIKRLEEEGYVIRIRCKEDKRAYNVFLTDKALDIKEEFFGILQSWENNITQPLTEEEIIIVKKILKKITVN
ncbi:MarR family winged helix-turn-helix transcriptional regulator [Clostridium septicum]|uniref:MarR family transcriptional regulator n=1 Tax=Clostridium septicum TaxID=1504 RepID=A0A9N7PKS7_CLOSE|nr:MarR family transcriptional regulator [Clostridium septicum]AYE34407.1 MarR family transcriptional regulator [Clostridium septicum]MDU1312530.1 MarR family transcriptional regulator [Clostridium septicum]QAS59812.1 MarR family transcriptional regulator [Clostridium septicum]UEC20949.1 MarR family transcriptional regulator [Clostridium septicum]USS01003.1 MarR family transcriptional regulator [Clostridium septicum]